MGILRLLLPSMLTRRFVQTESHRELERFVLVLVLHQRVAANVVHWRIRFAFTLVPVGPIFDDDDANNSTRLDRPRHRFFLRLPLPLLLPPPPFFLFPTRANHFLHRAQLGRGEAVAFARGGRLGLGDGELEEMFFCGGEGVDSSLFSLERLAACSFDLFQTRIVLRQRKKGEVERPCTSGRKALTCSSSGSIRTGREGSGGLTGGYGDKWRESEGRNV